MAADEQQIDITVSGDFYVRKGAIRVYLGSEGMPLAAESLLRWMHSGELEVVMPRADGSEMEFDLSLDEARHLRDAIDEALEGREAVASQAGDLSRLIQDWANERGMNSK